ncbi:DNA replication/repair protein RecF [Pelagerythrobacter marensis]|uniref:DNA replication and repair protein RecF n=1 Tax=Pelagerythrobacter marensis TaxID=543877 RepID=A0ABZ2D3G5_9SPHN
MALDLISLSDFRNHARSELSGTGHFNLLTGENGAGKTNVLEALSLLAPGRGLRRAPLAEMPLGGGDGFSVGATLTDGSGEPVRLGTFVRPDRPNRRRVQVNGAEASAASLGEWLALSWLTPAMDRLFADSAGGRRRFVDRMTLALDPAHARQAARYEAALRERNRLLGDEAPPDPVWLDGVERHMAEHGSALARSRARTIAAVAAALAEFPDEPFARPTLAYAAGGPVDLADFAAALRESRRRDRQAGRTLTGPHRDDMEVVMAGKDVPAAICSTGEQKAMLIAITLAHAELAARGRPGVLLLDEVAAHLDPVRREALFDRLRAGGSQVWLTGTEPTPFAAIAGEAAMWMVERGQLARR